MKQLVKNNKSDVEGKGNVLVRFSSPEVVNKLQAIANIEGVSFNDIYNIAFAKFIEVYEAKNGKVKVRPKGKGLEGI